MKKRIYFHILIAIAILTLISLSSCVKSKNNKISSEVFTAEIDRYAKAGQYEKAFELVEELWDEHSKSVALTVIADNYSEAGHKEKALETLNKALKLAEKIKEDMLLVYDKGDVLAEISGKAINFVETEHKDKALEIFNKTLELVKKLEDENVRSNVLANIAGNCAEAGQKEKALELISQALKISEEEIKDVHSKCYALANIAKNYAKIGQKEKALELLNKAQKIAKEIKDETDRTDALSIITSTYKDIKK